MGSIDHQNALVQYLIYSINERKSFLAQWAAIFMFTPTLNAFKAKRMFLKKKKRVITSCKLDTAIDEHKHKTYTR